MVPDRNLTILHLVVDLSCLNHFVDPYQFPMLMVAYVHLALHPSAWFATLNLESAYWHVPIAPCHSGLGDSSPVYCPPFWAEFSTPGFHQDHQICGLDSVPLGHQDICLSQQLACPSWGSSSVLGSQKPYSVSGTTERSSVEPCKVSPHAISDSGVAGHGVGFLNYHSSSVSGQC